MRRKAGALVPLEHEIISAIGREPGIYGYRLATLLTGPGRPTLLLTHGTLYKALARLVGAGLIESWLEDADGVGLPRRRCYRLTSAGEGASVS